jgi:uncharacterized membrane protein
LSKKKHKKHKHKNKITHPPSNLTNQDHLINDNPIPPQGTAKLIRTEARAFSGPIPPPELLDKYNQMIPDGADRILKMAERQSAHRQHIEKWAVIGGTILSYFGVLCAACIAFGALYLGYRLIQNGHVIPGAVLGGGGLTGLVAAFIYGTRSRREERQRRERQNRELIQHR